ncbi:hypothetical protein MMC09_000835 [Bachmanniomyces sp. S44760]|nr:hypothetical protein [Bachmanniomyces sp. S44760]
MAMMASGSSGNPYEHYEDAEVEQDLIDPDDVNINDLDDPLESDRAPLTGNIQSSSSRNPLPQSYLNSSIPGEDRRAPTNTIDESVWETLSRDLKASWEKMRQVLWPKYLLGGMLQRGGGIGEAEQATGNSLAGGLRGIAGRWPDPEVLLEGSMSEGLRDWDLWWVHDAGFRKCITSDSTNRGPLVFSLCLSLLLALASATDQRENVFTGVFSLVWIGSVVVTWQIRLLGGKM